MTPGEGRPPSAAARRARAEAAAWLAKLHGTDRTTQTELAWRRWVDEHPDHRAAWEFGIEVWGDTGDLPAVLPLRLVPRESSRFAPWLLKSGAAVGLVCLILLGWAIRNYYGSMLTTGVGEQRTLNLPDGSRVELNTNSRLLLRFDDHTRKVVLSSGEAYFAVAHERRPFVVVVGARKVIAVGTSFVVRHDVTENDTIRVTLIEGRVAVAAAAAPNVLPARPSAEFTLLTAGHRWTEVGHNAPMIDTPSMAKETAWRHGQLIFESTPLSDAVAEFNRYNQLQIKIASPEIGAVPVGGIFRTGDAASFAAVVADTHHFRLTQKDRELLLEPVRPDPRQR